MVKQILTAAIVVLAVTGLMMDVCAQQATELKLTDDRSGRIRPGPGPEGLDREV